MKIILVSFAALLLHSVSAQSFDKEKIDRYFDRLAEKNKAMGNLVLAKQGTVIYSRCIGYSQISPEGKEPLIPANKFRMGSVTKTFTATIIMQLVEEGKLKLTDKLAKFFPQVPNAEKITIEQILSHRSGIPEISNKENAEKNFRTSYMSKEDHLALIVQTPPDFEPGSKAQYSNSGYFVLGLVIEKITGKDYSKVLEKNIAQKIGLKDTYLATGNIDVTKQESLTYFKVPGGDWRSVPETHPSLLFSAGGLISTPYDMARFMDALFNGKLISKQSLEKMLSMKDGEGFGMVIFDFAGKTFYGHTGGADNYGAWMAYQPEEKLALAYTTNAKVYPVKDIVEGVMDIYYNQPFEIPTFESVAVSAELLDQYAGEYSVAGAPARFKILRKGDTLYAQPASEKNPVPLQATAQDTFKLDNGSPAGIVFVFDTGKKQMTIKVNGGERILVKQE